MNQNESNVVDASTPEVTAAETPVTTEAADTNTTPTAEVVDNTVAPVAADNTTADTAKPAKFPNRWEQLTGWMEEGRVIEIEVNADAEKAIQKSNQGRPSGIRVAITGLGPKGDKVQEGFIPGSEFPRGDKLTDQVGKRLRVKIIKVDGKTRGGRVVLSVSAVIKDEQKAFLAAQTVGAQVTGTIVRAVPQLGYFVNIGPSVDALLHEGQVPFKNGQAQTLEVGTTVTARIISIKVEEGKIGLSLRPPRKDGDDRGRNGGNRNGNNRDGNNRGGNNRGGGNRGGNNRGNGGAFGRDRSASTDRSTGTNQAEKFKKKYENRTTGTPQGGKDESVTASVPTTAPVVVKKHAKGSPKRKDDGYNVSFSNFADLALFSAVADDLKPAFIGLSEEERAAYLKLSEGTERENFLRAKTGSAEPTVEASEVVEAPAETSEPAAE